MVPAPAQPAGAAPPPAAASVPADGAPARLPDLNDLHLPVPRTVQAINAAMGNGRQRLALLVGIGTVGHQQVLDTEPRDLQAMAATLRACGFVVMLREDVGGSAVRAALREFQSRLQPTGIGFVYLTGLGLQIDGKDLLLPRETVLDAGLAPKAEADRLRRSGVPIAEAVDALVGPAGSSRMLVVDAAYRHPALDGQPAQGLAEPQLAPGVMALFGHALGSVQEVPAVAPLPQPVPDDPRAVAASRFARVLVGALLAPRVSGPAALRATQRALSGPGMGPDTPWLGGDTDDKQEFAQSSIVDSLVPRTPEDWAREGLRQAARLTHRTGGASTTEPLNPAPGPVSATEPANPGVGDRLQAGAHAAPAGTAAPGTGDPTIQPGAANGSGAIGTAVAAAGSVVAVGASVVPAGASLKLAEAATAATATASVAGSAASTAAALAGGVASLAAGGSDDRSDPPAPTPGPQVPAAAQALASPPPVTDPPIAPPAAAAPTANPPAMPTIAPAPPVPGATAIAGRQPTDGRTVREADGGERPVYRPRTNAFGYAEGDTFTYQTIDRWKGEVVGLNTTAIEEVLDNGKLLANGQRTALDAQGRLLRELNADGSVSTFSPCQDLWWARPVTGQRHDIDFTETLARADQRLGQTEWTGTAQVGRQQTISLPAGDFVVLPIESSGWWTRRPTAGPRVSGRWERTVWYSTALGNPVAIDIEDKDPQGGLARRERVELLQAQTAHRAP